MVLQHDVQEPPHGAEGQLYPGMDGTIKILHVAGKCNVSDVFTKEIRDKALFRPLRDSFMNRLSDFVRRRS